MAGAALVGLLALPGTSAADHVSISGTVGAAVEKLEPSRATVRISWDMHCQGAQNVDWGGNLNLVDNDTGERTYLGGVFGAYGQSSASATRIDKDRYVHVELSMWCAEGLGGHGSETEDFASGPVLIPRADPSGGGGGGGGSGSGGGGGSSGGSPEDPLASGGCAVELLGTPLADNLVGSAASELIFALGGDDRVTAGEGHDCLIGDSGDDRLNGQGGSDRLTGGSGNDLLTGGPGKNAYDAGPGNDTVKAKNGKKETVKCGPGKDSARVDKGDRVSGCEKLSG